MDKNDHAFETTVFAIICGIILLGLSYAFTTQAISDYKAGNQNGFWGDIGVILLAAPGLLDPINHMWIVIPWEFPSDEPVFKKRPVRTALRYIGAVTGFIIIFCALAASKL